MGIVVVEDSSIRFILISKILTYNRVEKLVFRGDTAQSGNFFALFSKLLIILINTSDTNY